MSTEPTITPPIAADFSEMTIALTLPCARCGYDLRNLQADGDCPECGEPIRLTVIESVDPAARRLSPIRHPIIVGNAIAGTVTSFVLSTILAVVALIVNAPSTLPTPRFIHNFPANTLLWGAAGFGFLAFLFLFPMLRMCQKNELTGCRSGIIFTGFGLLVWSCSMLLMNFVMHFDIAGIENYSMLFDTCLPSISAGIVFSGFRKLIPRLGQRSRAFRQAQGSRQRMKDLLVALVVIIVGRTMLNTSPTDSNLSILGLIIMVMSVSFTIIGLLYVLRNTIWIRNALVTPPPTLSELLHVHD